jgi:hypothetical protein
MLSAKHPSLAIAWWQLTILAIDRQSAGRSRNNGRCAGVPSGVCHSKSGRMLLRSKGSASGRRGST